MAYIVMAYIVMAYIVMASARVSICTRTPVHTSLFGLHSYGAVQAYIVIAYIATAPYRPI